MQIKIIRKIRFWLIACSVCIACLPSLVFACDFTLSGFGSSVVNGDYTATGATQNGLPVYSNGSVDICRDVSGNNGFIADPTECSGGSGSVYYIHLSPPASAYASPDTANWQQWDIGSNPVGTVSACASPTPTPTPSPSDATSTVDQVQNNLNYGIWLFIITLTFTIWGLTSLTK